MNKEIKLIALDLDGPVLNSSKEISKENRLAINAARQKGVHVVLTTGRPLIAIQPFLKTLEMLDFEDFSITFNGGPYTTHCLVSEEGSHFRVLRIAANKRATGLSSSVATIRRGIYPGVAS